MATYTLISSNVLASSAASVTFSAIPATYTDLVLRFSVRSTGGYIVNNLFYVNGITTGTAMSYTELKGTGSAASSTRNSGNPYTIVGVVEGTDYTSNTFSSGEVYIPSYTASQNKPFSTFSVSETNATAAEMKLLANLNSSNTAISQIDIKPGDGFSYASGSSFYLYGISNA
jgi:hypothetical protein